eukprot:7267795-Prorocentrum_lima.AAC.1
MNHVKLDKPDAAFGLCVKHAGVADPAAKAEVKDNSAAKLHVLSDGDSGLTELPSSDPAPGQLVLGATSHAAECDLGPEVLPPSN